MNKERLTRWYIEPGPGMTNESLTAEMARLNELAGNERTINDNEGLEHSVIEVPYALVAMLQAGKKAFPFSFKVFSQTGGGMAREFKLHMRKKSSRIKAVRKIKEDLARLREDAEYCG